MENRLLNEQFIRQRSEELQIPFENLLVASVLEEIVLRIAGSENGESFWMKNSGILSLESYRKKVDFSLHFFIRESERFHYKKSDISELFAVLLRNYKKDAIHWKYQVWMDWGNIYVDVCAELSSVKIPIKIKLERVSEENLKPYVKDVHLFSNNNRTIQINCYPSEYVITEKYLEILEKLELLNDMSCYLDAYEILRKDILSGRKVWELLFDGCKERKIPVEEKRWTLWASYRDSRYMEKKWKAYLRRVKRKQPEWEAVMELNGRFLQVIWEHMCRNVVYLGDWMPELGRCID